MNRKYGCAVLAGGAGRRMGHVNKADLEYRGRTFAETLTGELGKAGIPCYLSVANYAQSEPSGWKTVKDEVTGQSGEYVGPMGGIYSCLQRARSDGLDGLFFAPCDSPLYTADAVRRMAEYIGEDNDAVLWRSADGRLQTAFGWYSVKCLPVMEQSIERAKYKLTELISRVSSRIIDTADAGLDDRIFRNINSPEDYESLGDAGARHILICGKKQVGKTTLIESIIRFLNVPVYGYSTRIFRDSDGISRVYMYPACDVDLCRDEDNYIGSTRGKVLDVNNAAFEQLGTRLIRSAKSDGIIVMDEIGFMERDAAEFRKAVAEAFDGDIHVLASIKDTDKKCDHIDMIMDHPDTKVFMLTEDNRDQVAARVKSIVTDWKEAQHE